MKGKAIDYSPLELAFVQARRDLPRRELHAEFQRVFDRPEITMELLKALCTRRGWKTGRTGCFEKGQVPWSKGRRVGSRGRSKETQFKPGARPHTYRGPGHESVDKDGYVWIIVSERNPHTGAATRRVMKHRWLWERRNGPVPDGHCLKCVDSDKSNTDPANWLAIPRALLPKLNARWGSLSYDEAEPELKPFLLAVAQLEHAAREAGK